MRFIKLSEKIVDWEWFTDPKMVQIWVYLLVKAQQFEDGRYRGVDLKTGQIVTGRKEISRETGLSEQEVRTCLNRLKSTSEITIESTNKYSIITILKYDHYQSADAYGNQQINQQANQQSTNKQPAINQQSTTIAKILRNEDIKNIHKEEINKEEMDCSPEFAEALEAFAEMRKKIRKPLTEKAKQMVLKKLSSLAEDEGTQIEILNQSTMNSWQGVFPLPTQTGKEKKGLEALMQI